MNETAVRVVVTAMETDEEHHVTGQARYRLESWPTMLYKGAFVDIGGTDQVIETVRLRRTKMNSSYVVVELPLSEFDFQKVLTAPTWSDTPEEALAKLAF